MPLFHKELVKLLKRVAIVVINMKYIIRMGINAKWNHLLKKTHNQIIHYSTN